MEPIIEELITREEYYNLKDENVKVSRKFLGYSFGCWDCGWQGYLMNPNQSMCPKCGVPFHFEDTEDDPPEPCYSNGEDYNPGEIKKIIEPPMMGEEIIVNEQWEDIITDAT